MFGDKLTWIPMATCCFAALLSLPCIYLFLSIKFELRSLSRRAATKGEAALEKEATGNRLKQLASELEQLRSQLREFEQSRPDASRWVDEPASVQLNRQGQILRLYRKGKSIVEIASALHIPPGEVELLIKVHELAQSPARSENSENSEVFL
jgi:DNA-binding NarL/FixJ family response regulator